jgi:RsiW-degrading membrane proteinase PrsW (M82 family)
MPEHYAWLGFVLSLFPILVAFAIRKWVVIATVDSAPDRRLRAARGWLFPSCILLGAWGGAVFGVILVPPEMVADGPVEGLAAELFQAGIAVPAIEELGKALILWGLLWGGVLRNRLDGVILGLACGAGFACVESLLAYLQAAGWGSPDNFWTAVSLRLPFGTVIHMTSTAFVGMVLGMGQSHRRLSRRLLIAGFALPAGMVVHGLWNGLMRASSVTGNPVLGAMGLLVVTGALVVLGRSIRHDIRLSRA